jgi:hypothetical protein
MLNPLITEYLTRCNNGRLGWKSARPGHEIPDPERYPLTRAETGLTRTENLPLPYD